MPYGIALPPYRTVRNWERYENAAVKKYYHFPFNLFYVKKLKMIVDMLEPKKIYRNILDYGAGAAQIFETELEKHAIHVIPWHSGRGLVLENRWKFDVVICASVLEFVNLEATVKEIEPIMTPKGIMIVASPIESWVSKLYFKLVGSTKYRRHSHKIIRTYLQGHFNELDYKEWFGLYFVMKVRKR